MKGKPKAPLMLGPGRADAEPMHLLNARQRAATQKAAASMDGARVFDRPLLGSRGLGPNQAFWRPF
jgi:hypothetical protein